VLALRLLVIATALDTGTEIEVTLHE